MEKNYLVDKKDQIMIVASDHIAGGYKTSAVYYKNHNLYLDEPEIEYIKTALECGYLLLGIIQGNDYKEIKKQLQHMTQAL